MTLEDLVVLIVSITVVLAIIVFLYLRFKSYRLEAKERFRRHSERARKHGIEVPNKVAEDISKGSERKASKDED